MGMRQVKNSLNCFTTRNENSSICLLSLFGYSELILINKEYRSFSDILVE